MAKTGTRKYDVRLNSSPEVIATLNDLPIKTVDGVPVYIRDVAFVHEGAAVQTNIVRQNGRRTAIIPVLKSGLASTLDVIEGIKKELPRVKATAPEAQLLNSFAQTRRTSTVAVVSDYDIQRVLDIYASVEGRDLGGVGKRRAQHHGGSAEKSPKRPHHFSARADRLDENFLHRPGAERPGGYCAAVPADGSQFSELAGSVHHHHGLPGGRCGCCS